MRETTVTVWVVDTDFHRVPRVREFQAYRVGGESVTVADEGRTVVIKAAGSRKWFTDKDAVKAHLREVYTRLKASLEKELARATLALADDKYPATRVSPNWRHPVSHLGFSAFGDLKTE